MGEKSSLESPTETKEELKIEKRTRTSQPNWALGRLSTVLPSLWLSAC